MKNYNISNNINNLTININNLSINTTPENDGYSTPKTQNKTLDLCGQTNCFCERASDGSIHCKYYSKQWPCKGKNCNCFIK
jgi:hypothetical protein